MVLCEACVCRIIQQRLRERFALKKFPRAQQHQFDGTSLASNATSNQEPALRPDVNGVRAVASLQGFQAIPKACAQTR